MDDTEKCVLGAVNEEKIKTCAKRIDKIDRVVFWMFSTSIATLFTAITILIKELV